MKPAKSKSLITSEREAHSPAIDYIKEIHDVNKMNRKTKQDLWRDAHPNDPATIAYKKSHPVSSQQSSSLAMPAATAVEESMAHQKLSTSGQETQPEGTYCQNKNS